MRVGSRWTLARADAVRHGSEARTHVELAQSHRDGVLKLPVRQRGARGSEARGSEASDSGARGWEARRSEAAERDLRDIAFHIALSERRPLAADRIVSVDC